MFSQFHQALPASRREFLQRCGTGLGALSLAGMLADEEETCLQAAEKPKSPTAARSPHFPAKAKAIIHIFLNGGPSQVDTFDPKPALKKYAGKSLPSQNLRTERTTGGAFPSPFQFKKYGESGIEISEIFSELGECADDLCVIRSMHANVPNHEPSLMLMNCGEQIQSRPSAGAWINYGLGTENQNLPGFIVLCPGGYPVAGSLNWRSSFLPGVYQGTYIDSQYTQIEKLIANIKNKTVTKKVQRKQLDLLQKLNRKHQEQRSQEAALEARIHTFELAYRMQMQATDVFDVSQEPQSIHKMYGTGTHARQTMIARRLVERGVRYVQLWHGKKQPWDSHEKIEKEHRKLAKECSQPIAALMKDLKQRGLLDSTLILIGGEFGRTPVVELATVSSARVKTSTGRDHNHYGFSVVLAGGGVKGGMTYGATDEFGFKAIENRVHVHDLHATMLKLLGLDHKKLTFRFSGRDFRLTDVHGEIVDKIIA
ncbi:hypothetical protein-putative related to sulfatases [hydrothermal vent metagenome]|uniref:Sulfatase n=1 Tax=hydrothermal vent metagenome TaxID=652676 RepID=A0A3B1DAH0_9ZZZZ